MSLKDSIQLRLKKLKYQILYPRSVFEYEVAEIRISNENIRRYRFQHLKKEFFSISIKGKDDAFKYLYYLLCLLLLVLLPIIGIKNGISDKEIEQHHRSELLYEYYANDNPEILHQPNARTQTQTVDFLCYCAAKWLHIQSVYDFRHVVGALFAWLIIVVMGSFLMNLFSWRAAFFGNLMLSLSPHFFGQSFGNLADISFTFFYLLAIYEIFILIGELPIVKWKRLAFIVLSIAAANTIHTGGFVLLHYLFLSVILSFFLANPISKFFTKSYFRNLGKLLLILVCVTVTVYALYLLSPLQNLRSIALLPSSGILEMAKNQPVTQLLWNSQLVSTHDFTVGFILQRMWFTMPLLVIIGMIVHLVVLKKVINKINFPNSILLLLAMLHPLWTLKGKTCEIYDGWAIYLMIYPFIVMFATAGYEGLLRKIDDRYTNFVIVSMILLLCIMPLRHVFIHYNNLEVYFNEISGGISNAYGKYAIDEGQNANRAACLWVIENAHSQQDTTPIRVFTDGNAGCDYYFRQYSDLFDITHKPLHKSDDSQWDYFISFSNTVPPEKLQNKSWERLKAVKRIYVENKPIAVILHNTPAPPPAETTSTEEPMPANNRPSTTKSKDTDTSPFPTTQQVETATEDFSGDSTDNKIIQ